MKAAIKTVSRDYVRHVPPLQVFSQPQLEEIHYASLEVLRRTGVCVQFPEAVELLRKAGCHVEGGRVYIPCSLVEWAIRSAPAQVVLCDRDGNQAIRIEGYKPYYGTGSDCIFVLDPYSGERRPARLEDVASFARLVDALPNMDFAMGMSVANDVPESIADILQFQAMVTNTVKPMVYAVNDPKSLRTIIEMCEVIAGGADAFRRKPFALVFGCSISPLLYSAGPTESLLYTAEKGLPYILAPTASAGGTGPVTLPGALVQINAEMLAGLVMAQLGREGTPFIMFAGCPTPLDMKTTIASYGSPEFLMFQVGLTQLQHYQGLPTFGTTGCSDSKVFDQQATLEGAMSMLVSSLSGANLIHDVGYVEYGTTSCFEQVVTMNELAGEIRFLLQGMEVSRETLALDVIDAVGPGGEYVSSDHTLRHFRNGWFPEVIGDRNVHDTWVQRGRKTLGDRANEKVREILENHVPKPLPEAIQARLEALIDEARVREGVGAQAPR
ncbi:MAG TPA: trimethylamine methyltransferase family protein [Anaerolineae bacterium]|nr:trimethylamine methyltransferase family protein [Anaerolineae bacterium]